MGLADGADGAARMSLPFLSRVVARALPAAWAGLHALSAPAFQALAGMRGAAGVSVRCGVVSPTFFLRCALYLRGGSVGPFLSPSPSAAVPRVARLGGPVTLAAGQLNELFGVLGCGAAKKKEKQKEKMKL